MSKCKRAIAAVIKYCEGAPSHSALSTVYLLAVEALEEYDAEKEQQNEKHNPIAG